MIRIGCTSINNFASTAIDDDKLTLLLTVFLANGGVYVLLLSIENTFSKSAQSNLRWEFDIFTSLSFTWSC